MMLRRVLLDGVLDGSTSRGWWARRILRRYRRMFSEGMFEGESLAGDGPW